MNANIAKLSNIKIVSLKKIDLISDYKPVHLQKEISIVFFVSYVYFIDPRTFELWSSVN